MDPLFPELDATRRARGERLRDEAMGRVEAAAPPSWQDAAERALRYAAEHRPELTSEVVWSLLEAWGWPMPREPRALGPIMRKAEVSYAWIVSTGRFELASRPSRHRAPVKVYRSLLFHQAQVQAQANGRLSQTTFVVDESDPW